jgi:hypothetical protein
VQLALPACTAAIEGQVVKIDPRTILLFQLEPLGVALIGSQIQILIHDMLELIHGAAVGKEHKAVLGVEQGVLLGVLAEQQVVPRRGEELHGHGVDLGAFHRGAFQIGGLYPYMFVQDDGIAFNMILTYVGSKKLDIKTVNVTADDNMYTFTCDEEYGGGYDQDMGCWFDMELFQLSDEEISWLSEWLNAKSVTAVFVGRDGTTQSYALTKENRTAIQEMVTAYNLMLSSTVEQCEPILTSLAK